jgi:hypothetical protein
VLIKNSASQDRELETADRGPTRPVAIYDFVLDAIDSLHLIYNAAETRRVFLQLAFDYQHTGKPFGRQLKCDSLPESASDRQQFQ